MIKIVLGFLFILLLVPFIILSVIWIVNIYVKYFMWVLEKLGVMNEEEEPQNQSY